MGDEGKVYLCDWKRGRSGYRIWWAERPEVFAEARSFAECEAELWENLMEATGDCEAQIGYRNGYPDSVLPERFSRPQYFELVSNCWGFLASDIDSLYAGTPCPVCERPRGERTSTPIALSKVNDPGDKIAVSKLRDGVVCSERLLAALGLLDSPQFECRPVLGLKSRLKYHEVLARDPSVNIERVAVKGFPGTQKRIECIECGWTTISLQAEDRRVLTVVAARDVKKVAGGRFLNRGSLCVPARDWRMLRDTIKPRWVAADQIGIARDEDIDENLPITFLRPPRRKGLY